jgi:hypothetical protein
MPLSLLARAVISLAARISDLWARWSSLPHFANACGGLYARSTGESITPKSPPGNDRATVVRGSRVLTWWPEESAAVSCGIMQK